MFRRSAEVWKLHEAKNLSFFGQNLIFQFMTSVLFEMLKKSLKWRRSDWSDWNVLSFVEFVMYLLLFSAAIQRCQINNIVQFIYLD